jgi:hypothetical protein
MTRLSRVGIALFAAGLVFTAQAGAAPPGEVVIERTTLHKEPFTVEELFPCLGAPGDQDDLAVITGFQTSQFTLTAAGVDEAGEPIAPFHLRANVHWQVTVDPVADAVASGPSALTPACAPLRRARLHDWRTAAARSPTVGRPRPLLRPRELKRRGWSRAPHPG